MSGAPPPIPYFPYQAQHSLKRYEFIENNIVNELVVYCLARLKYEVTKRHRDYLVYTVPQYLATKPKYNVIRVKNKLMETLAKMQWGVAHVGREDSATIVIYVKTMQQTQLRLQLES